MLAQLVETFDCDKFKIYDISADKWNIPSNLYETIIVRNTSSIYVSCNGSLDPDDLYPYNYFTEYQRLDEECDCIYKNAEIGLKAQIEIYSQFNEECSTDSINQTLTNYFNSRNAWPKRAFQYFALIIYSLGFFLNFLILHIYMKISDKKKPSTIFLLQLCLTDFLLLFYAVLHTYQLIFKFWPGNYDFMCTISNKVDFIQQLANPSFICAIAIDRVLIIRGRSEVRTKRNAWLISISIWATAIILSFISRFLYFLRHYQT